MYRGLDSLSVRLSAGVTPELRRSISGIFSILARRFFLGVSLKEALRCCWRSGEWLRAKRTISGMREGGRMGEWLTARCWSTGAVARWF